MSPAHVTRRVLERAEPMAEHDLIPNFTQFPNKLMDYVIPLLRESEEKVLIYVLRCTYGYQDKDGERKEQDYISYSQFMNGQVSKDGRLLNFGAGVSRSKLAEALAFHQATGLIERLDPAARKPHAGRGSTGLYRLNRHCELVHFLNQCLQDPENARERLVQFMNQKRRLVQKVNQSQKKAKKDKALTENGSESEPIKNGSESEPEMVQKVNQPKKVVKKEKETKDTPPISPSRAAPPSRGQDGFQAFWDAYPKHRHVKKAACVIIWHRLKPDDALQATILSALAQQRDSPDWKKQAGEFVPHPSAWLNQRRWEDEVATSSGFNPQGYFAREAARLEREEAEEKERRRHATERSSRI